MKVKKSTQEEINSTKDWGTWGKEPSEFPWHYDDKETCFILEREATVTNGQGNSITFSKGDWVEFEKGLSCTWKITKEINKRFIFG